MRLIDAATAAEIISKKLNIPIDVLVDVFAEIPTAKIRNCDNCGNGECTIGYIHPSVHCYAWKPRKGEWIDRTEYEDNIECPFCHETWNVIDNCTETFNFCPNCGADMRGEEDG